MKHSTAAWQDWACMGWTQAEVVEAVGAHSIGNEPRHFAAVSTDSRSITADVLFIALRGPRHDGHAFAGEALRRGAGAVVVDNIPSDVDPAAAFVVSDTLRALGDLAAYTRRRQAVRVAAITGSNGKTTTKEMVASICEQVSWPPPRTRVLKTLGTENNLIGVPATLLRLSGEEAVAVLEMGMNAAGEIARLTEIAAPDVGVITNVGPAHLEGLGSVAGVAAAKGELFAGMAPGTTIAVNADDEWVMRLAAGFRGRRIEFGAGREVDAQRVTSLGFEGTALELLVAGNSCRLHLHIPGDHMVRNALAAAAVCHGLGIEAEHISAGLEAATSAPMRMQVVRLGNGVTVVNDAYNANPASMEAAVRFVTQQAGRAVVVLGEMRELGAESATLHQRVGRVAAQCGVHVLVAVGPYAEDMARGARDGGMEGGQVHVCDDPNSAARAVIDTWRNGDTVLVKGSRGSADDPIVQRQGARMAEVVRLLEDAGSRP